MSKYKLQSKEHARQAAEKYGLNNLRYNDRATIGIHRHLRANQRVIDSMAIVKTPVLEALFHCETKLPVSQQYAPRIEAEQVLQKRKQTTTRWRAAQREIKA